MSYPCAAIETILQEHDQRTGSEITSTYMEYVKTQDFVTFREAMITETELCLILALWAWSLQAAGPLHWWLAITGLPLSLFLLIHMSSYLEVPMTEIKLHDLSLAIYMMISPFIRFISFCWCKVYIDPLRSWERIFFWTMLSLSTVGCNFWMQFYSV